MFERKTRRGLLLHVGRRGREKSVLNERFLALDSSVSGERYEDEVRNVDCMRICFDEEWKRKKKDSRQMWRFVSINWTAVFVWVSTKLA
jgi:hypothetical protein